MRFIVAGAGAVGGVFASALARVGHEVAVLARGAHREALRTSGMELTDLGQNRSTYPVHVILPNQPCFPADLMIVAMKAHSLPSAAHELSVLASGAPTIFVQNGLPWWYLDRLTSQEKTPGDPEGLLRSNFPQPAGAVVHFGAALAAPGRVRWTAPGQVFLSRGQQASAAPIAELAGALCDLGIASIVVDDLDAAIWQKLVVNVPLNAVAALTGASIDLMIADMELRRPLLLLADEISGLADKFGVRAILDLEMQMEITQPGQVSSTLQDIIAHKPIEHGALFGAPLWLGERVGHSLPMLQLLAPLIRKKAESAAKPHHFSVGVTV